MSLLQVPKWVLPHLYKGKNFNELSAEELSSLHQRISHFKAEAPEISVVIPAWNEENNIFRTLSSLAANKTKYKVEIIVINNNATDGTQKVLDTIGVRNYMQPEQGTSFARQMGLEKARGKYHLCADSDTFYPPDWIDLMVAPMMKDEKVVGVYGRYSFMPITGDSRAGFIVYEAITSMLVRLRKKNREHLNTLGFNMGFVTKIGLQSGGFKVTQVRKFDNARDSDYFVDEAEDGRMAVNLKTRGVLKLVTHPKARVFTSSRRLAAEGGIVKSFMNRLKLHTSRMSEYVSGK